MEGREAAVRMYFMRKELKKKKDEQGMPSLPASLPEPL